MMASLRIGGVDVPVSVCSPPTMNVRAILNCPNCKHRRRFTGFDTPWYGITLTCCTCGDTWTGGEMHDRPFARGWRQKSAAEAREAWSAGVRIGSPQHREFVDRTVPAGTKAPKEIGK